MLDVAVRRTLPDFTLDVAFSTGMGVTALFGPSGAGKSTILSMVAGLIRPDAGHVRIEGTALFDSGSSIDVPVRKRRIGFVFQDGRLFPHLSVRGNLDYGRRALGLAPEPALQDTVIEMLGIDGLLERRPGALSGGERQRVAIGRALLARPRLLLLDEPLASLDGARKAEILPYLERLRDEARVPILYVTHDRTEVDRLAATVIPIREGRVASAG